MTSWQFVLLKLAYRLKGWLEVGTPDIKKRRQSYESLTAKMKVKAGANCTPTTINGIPSEWVYMVDAELDRVILFLHGGAYCLCSVNTHRSMTANIAAAARARVLLIDYRMAPEHPFPAAVEDAVCAYQGLLELGIAPEQIAVAGDSAGGGLALALLVCLRDAGKPLPALAVCISPWTDLSLSGESVMTNAKKDVMLDFPTLAESARLYLDGTNPHHPLASPLFAELHDLPPLLIQVGSDEIILSDATRMAEKARAAGVDVTLEIWESMQHEWQFAADFVPEGQQAIDRIGLFIHQHFLRDKLSGA
jgi:monoterpene epsilon-lactone hydrolase